MTTDPTSAAASRTGLVSALFGRFRARRKRRATLACLLDMSVYQLDDLGLSGVEVKEAVERRARSRAR